MIKNSFKTFLKSIEYYFTPLGVIVFIVLLTLGILYPQMEATITNAYQQVATKIGDVSINTDLLSGYLINKFSDLSNTSEIFNPDNLINIFLEGLKVSTGIEEVGQDIIDILSNAADQLIGNLITILIFSFLSVFISFVLLIVLLRRRVTDCSFIYATIISLIQGLFLVGFMVLLSYLLDKNRDLTIAITVIAIVIFVFTSIFFSYLFFGRKKIAFRQLFSLKTYFAYLLSSIIVIGIGIGLWFGLKPVLDSFIFYLIMVPLIELVVCLVIINGETTISYLIENNSQQ